MTYAVRFTSLKGKTLGQIVTEKYSTGREALMVAAVMRAGGHEDAVAVRLPRLPNPPT
jgi:predicted MarR family transcription regulator